MDKKILFGIFGIEYRMRFGEFIQMLHACYFRGKELGYTDDNIYMRWPYRIAYDNDYVYPKLKFMKCPDYSVLPIKFTQTLSRYKESDYDKIINLKDEGVFYENSPPLYVNEGTPDIKRIHTGFMNYPNVYYYTTGKKPIIKIPKDKLEKPYILFHIRIANWAEYRNPDLINYKKVLDMLEPYRDEYEIWKTGELCNSLDKRFDFVAPYYPNDINKTFKLVNNATLTVGCDSGFNVIGDMFNAPYIQLDSPKIGKDGNPYITTDAGWKLVGGIGKTLRDYREIGKDNIILRKGDELDKEKIMTFIKKILGSE